MESTTNLKAAKSSFKFRPYIYGIIITIGFALLLNILETLPKEYFFVATLLLYLVILFEIYTALHVNRKNYIQFKFDQTLTREDKTQIIHHIALPTLLYFSLAGYLNFNYRLSLHWVVLIIVFLLFTLLFINIRAYYVHNNKLENITHNVYDLLTIIISFFSTVSIFEILRSTGLFQDIMLIIYLSFISGIILYRFNLFKSKYIKFISAIAVSSVLISIVSIGIIKESNILGILYAFLTYILLAVANHLNENSLTRSVIIEYISVSVLFIVLISVIT